MTLTQLNTHLTDHPSFCMIYEQAFVADGVDNSIQINFADEAWQLVVNYNYTVDITALSEDAAQTYWITNQSPSSFVLNSKVPWPASTLEAGIPNVSLRFKLTRCFNIDAG